MGAGLLCAAVLWMFVEAFLHFVSMPVWLFAVTLALALIVSATFLMVGLQQSKIFRPKQ
jgi:hypothetical protein